MTVDALLDLTASELGERVAVGNGHTGMSFAELEKAARKSAAAIRSSGVRTVVFVGTNGNNWTTLLFAAAQARVPVAPLNYRLSASALAGLIQRLQKPLVIADAGYVDALAEVGVQAASTETWLDAAQSVQDPDRVPTDEGAEQADVAVILFTSGTTSEPKAVLLRHSHLFSYVLETVEFGSATADEAALVSVPPYHVAGVGTILTNTYAGRRVVYLENFTAEGWLDTVQRERVTQAMLVPTMLSRTVDLIVEQQVELPSLRSIAYGGAATPRPLLERALRALPDVGFTNSYGLTESSSTIALLGPAEHRKAFASDDPRVRNRLNSVGRLIPGVQARILDSDGLEVGIGMAGELQIRGTQVSGEYLDGSALDADGWFDTRDQALLDDDGFLYILGRSDDTIIRGGENIAPAEIESVLQEMPGIADVAIVGGPDPEWGQCIVVFVVADKSTRPSPEEIRGFARNRLRGSRTPDVVLFRDQLPYSPLGKLLRKELAQNLTLGTSENWT